MPTNLPMLSVSEATHLVQQYLPDWGSEQLNLNNCITGRLAETITTDRAYPPIDRVMMDGIALSFDTYNQGQRSFSIAGTAFPGAPPLQLDDPLTCLEVMTGAPLPIGCDLVIPYEYIHINGGIASIHTDQEWSVFAHIHRRGSDLSAHREVLKAGTVLQPPHWGILASLGHTQIEVTRSPRTLIIGTGDELIDPQAIPEPYQLRRSNIYALRSALQKYGYSTVEVISLGDDYQELKEHYQKAVPTYEQLIYTGGISKGKRDFLPAVWSEMGVTCYVQGVRQKPGKPLYFGVDQRHKTAIFGLPGNPVSSLICLYRYILPIAPFWVKLMAPVNFLPPLTYFLPVKISSRATAEIWAEPRPVNNSGDFLGLADSDGFVELPSDRSEFWAGEWFPFYPW